MLHGLMDNCGSFEGIQPHLPSGYRCISIDLPGHGLSSHLPAGVMYDFFKGVTYIALVRRFFGWEQFSLLGHSLGAGMALLYASCFPLEVHSLAVLDPVMLTVDESKQPDVTRDCVLAYTKMMEKRLQTPPTGVPYEELRHRVMSHALIADPAAADTLLVRGCRRLTSDTSGLGRMTADREQTTPDPARSAAAADSTDGSTFDLHAADSVAPQPAAAGAGGERLGPDLYCLTSDPVHRITSLLQSLSARQYAAYLSRLQCRLLVVLADDGDRWGTPQDERIALEACKRALGSQMTTVTVPGTHHVHLCHPGRVLGHVVNFLDTWDGKECADEEQAVGSAAQ
ncbi:probable serine hydrolase [Pollicipes pollicipes]|uniref:probable serine hydrolase n=1 Tax=Pollicipes pollicipes TaxID=41117 RepID=UPI00188556FB|nr:probable serine hydrolase [Pollicipes pollicipes]